MTDYLAQLERDGFVVVRSILSDEQLSALLEASRKAAELARSGHWPHIRTVGKQFPPWESTPPAAGIWGVQHLMNPSLPGNEVFASAYFSEAILSIVRDLLGGCGDDELVMELFNMLVRPGEDFALVWHRDDIPADATAEQEMERLGRPAFHAQFNLALLEDDSLVVVPGSHARPRTEAERRADPLEPRMPGQKAVRLAPGDIVFYNNNILHRGVYSSARERLTVHGSVGHTGGSKLRARNVLQHGVGSWVDRCDFSGLRDDERARAEAMRDRLVRLGTEAGDVGYSLQG
ncbi:Phytanoyl-CoA dioxygenase (PhyH) [Geosmithia morbida]|uniref:Phytanoyl-CoA dioxygenase (PhyH) n=1 Tax=Geosmithia morbida TaxID=1094350 RepID=A0A9P4Z0U5_9HYPO|nr:Phytanoyl-CoA dioxygenase (PhyH) [Geosmithia morbida]KAF4125620.1 Phytanoyl-CoA dioxygenase (PhyH) [Geosmithia morbida]